MGCKFVGIPQEIHNLLKLFAKKTQISLSIDKIKHFCLHRIIAVGKQDPVILLYAFGGYSYQTRVTRFYSQIPISNIVAELNKFWHDVKTTINQIDPDWLLPEGLGTFQEVPPLLTAQPLLIGSKVMPSLAELNKLTGRLASPFSTANKAMVQQSIDALINYHNHYVTYTAMMLLAATGYRAVRNPLPLLSLFLPHYHCMVISDKDDEDFTNTRIVAVGSILAQQLNYYQNHIEKLCNLIIILKPELGEHIHSAIDKLRIALLNSFGENQTLLKSVKNNVKLPGPLFELQMKQDSLQCIAISPKTLKARLKGFKFPINFGRHVLRSYLLKKQLPSELINFQLGHWSTGEAALGDYSSFELNEAINLLTPIIDEMLQEQGWQALPTLLV
ncbi:hypothetical protein [Alishewanella sp. HL-SH06]|uniref:hypothetical protein n=1 Tax=Alishewanella sp. HL-SH06 TaxID=3461144 RepID=UPI004041C61B